MRFSTAIGSSFLPKYLRPPSRSSRRAGSKRNNVGNPGLLRAIGKLAGAVTARAPPILKNIHNVMKLTSTWGYYAASAYNYAATANDVLDQFCYSTSTTTANRLIQCFRIKHIEIWIPPTSTASPGDVQSDPGLFFWATGTTDVASAPIKPVYIQSLGFDDPAYVKLKPPRDSAAGMWHSDAGSDTQTLFHAQLATGAKLRLCIEWILVPGNSTISFLASRAVTSAVSCGGAGLMGLRGFPASASRVLTPEPSCGFDTI